jgi:hypothetical protein
MRLKACVKVSQVNKEGKGIQGKRLSISKGTRE